MAVDRRAEQPKAGAWLTTVAKRKAIDHWRRRDNLGAKYTELARDLETHLDEPAWDPDHIDDDVLRLIFIAAHPVLSRENQIALTLGVVAASPPRRSPGPS